MPEPPVAVVIPVWDAYVRHLEEAVESVRAQDTACELVVVDNASDVPVPTLAGTTVLHAERRLSSGAARNLGFAATTAPLVVFLDADDVLLPGALAALVTGIERRPDAVAFAMAIVDGDTGERHRAPRRLARSLARMPRVFALANAMWSLLPTQGATIMRAAAVRAVGGYADRSHGEDWTLGASLAWRGRVCFDPRPALVYRWRHDSPGRGGEAGTLHANARAVRERLRCNPAARRLLPLVTAGQWLAIAAVRPAVLALRRDVAAGEPVRIARVIARLNVGGPSIQAITLTRLLDERGYATVLIRGTESPDEGTMDDLAERLRVTPVRVPSLRRDPGPHDLRALLAIARLLRRQRPQIVHTHAAKGGTLGRLAAMLAFPLRRPLLVHTYHGHSLRGYFGARTTNVYRTIERVLGRFTHVLIAVSDEVRDDLVALGVAPADRLTVVPIGLPLERLLDDRDRAERRAALRGAWGVADDERLVTLVARLVPIKRVDRFLAVAGLLAERPGIRFAIVGDGELRASLQSSAAARALGERLIWTGFQRDMPAVYAASDVVVLTSDNEGTPVSLIEAQAAGVPVVSTDVGGVRSVVRRRETGLTAPADDNAALAAAVAELLDDPALAARLAGAARERAATAFAIERLVDDVDALYRRLLAQP